MALAKIEYLFHPQHRYFTYSYKNLSDYYEMFEYVCANSHLMNIDGKNMLRAVFVSFERYHEIQTNQPRHSGHLLKQWTFREKFSEFLFKYDCYETFKQNIKHPLDCSFYYDIDKLCDYDYICVYGNLNILNQLATKNIKLTDKNMCNICKHNYVEILKCFFDKKIKRKHSKECITIAFENGNLDILKFLHSRGVKLNFNYKAIEKATLNKHFKLLNWLNSNGYVIKSKKVKIFL